jgi:hypothetical protein
VLKLKKSLIVFFVAIALYIGLSFLSAFVTSLRSEIFSNSLNVSSSGVLLQAAYGVVFSLIEVVVVFSVFYYLGKRAKIQVVKSTTLALIFGLLIGSFILLAISAVSIYSSVQGFSYIWLTFSSILGFASSTFFYLFFPALSALMFAKLNVKNSANPYPSENKPVVS